MTASNSPNAAEWLLLQQRHTHYTGHTRHQNLNMASNETNLINPLTFVDGKFKWLGDFELLKRFVETTLNIKGKWKVPRGSCKELKTADITIRWYENGSLLIEGSMIKEYQAILQKIATIKPNCECDLDIDNLVDFTPPQKPSLN